MAADYFLELEGVKGESHDSEHKDKIDVLSWSWGETNAGSFSHGGGGGSGKVNVQDFHFTKKFDKSSPVMLRYCASGKHFPKGTLFCRKAGDGQKTYMTWKFTDILVSSYSTGGHGGGDDIPLDQISFNFAKVEFEYKPQKADGSLDGPVKAILDVKGNKYEG